MKLKNKSHTLIADLIDLSVVVGKHILHHTISICQMQLPFRRLIQGTEQRNSVDFPEPD